jgi:hypothetical protein
VVILNIAEYIEEVRQQQGRSKSWLAAQMNINYKTFFDKLKNNRFSAEELLLISRLLNIDLEKLKEKVEL